MERLGVMEVFVLAVETRVFSAVGRRLGLGQPTVSKLIAQLEERLGSRLLLRSTRGLAPTEAGEAYDRRAREILAQVNEADAMVQQCRAGLSGRLRVSAPVTFARLHIIPHLSDFLRDHPGLDRDPAGRWQRRSHLGRHRCRLAARGAGGFGAGGPPPLPLRDAGAGHSGLLRGQGHARLPQGLQDHDLVLLQPKPGMGQQWLFCREDERIAVRGRGRLTVSAAEGMRAAVLAGLGLGIASEWMFARACPGGGGGGAAGVAIADAGALDPAAGRSRTQRQGARLPDLRGRAARREAGAGACRGGIGVMAGGLLLPPRAQG